jgi:uncharacterized metal-binding protein
MTSGEFAHKLAKKWAETLSAVGPMRADIQEAIDAAVAEERESCAVIALDEFATHCADGCTCSAAEDIADAIRARSGE